MGAGKVDLMDRGSLYRLALARLGTAELVEGSPEWLALEECSQQAVRVALDYSNWRFALKGPVSLPVVAGVAELPEDCLELREVRGSNRWEVYGRRLVVQDDFVDSVQVVYKSNEVAEAMVLPVHEPLFCEACVCLVAAAVAGRVAGDARLGAELEQLGMQLLYRAKLKEARSVASNDGLKRKI